MNKVEMTSLKSHRYGTKSLEAGDAFEADSKDVNLLKALGRASRNNDEQSQEKSSEQDKVVVPRQRRNMTAAKKDDSKTGVYNRRDLRARS